MKAEDQPFYKKLTFNLLSIGILCVALIYGSDLIMPLLFAILLATLLLPITRFLVRKKFPKFLSIILPILLAMVVGGGIIYLLSSQIIHFMDDLPALKARFDEVGYSIQKWFRASTDMTIRKQNVYVKQAVDNLKEKAPQIAGVTVGSITGIVVYLFLVPIYTFLVLYYRGVIKKFLVKVFKNGSEENVREILTQSTTISQQFVSGLMIETTIVFVLNTAGFLILGIKYAVFLALLAALLNLIPYVGMLTANILCMVITLVTSNSTSEVLWVGAILALVQVIDNNITMPLIVGNRVRINALATIIGVLIGGALCGIPGMFLAIPALAVCKVICDRVTELKPWGELLGDSTDMEQSNGNKKKIKQVNN
ncbi:MAG TPA: AI-2E family transporter [Chryseolinea sp.]|nr:AI-2E family transporter [Chryseolinea sp.]HPM31013.1 AI-2E family transporter [Chryseolinea sp.]